MLDQFLRKASEEKRKADAEKTQVQPAAMDQDPFTSHASHVIADWSIRRKSKSLLRTYKLTSNYRAHEVSQQNHITRIYEDRQDGDNDVEAHDEHGNTYMSPHPCARMDMYKHNAPQDKLITGNKDQRLHQNSCNNRASAGFLGAAYNAIKER